MPCPAASVEELSRGRRQPRFDDDLETVPDQT
jgi:hypothetical protein